MSNGSRSRFVHLHVHSEYSLLDGANRIKLQEAHAKSSDTRVKSLLQQVHDFGMNAVALTDHGNLCGALEFYAEARKHGIKAILGMEAYMAAGNRLDRTGRTEKEGKDVNHLTLLVKDETGYRNLVKLSSLGHEEGFYYRPRIDRELLAKYSAGLICLSGCLAAEVPELIMLGKPDDALRLAGWYKDLFGADRYFIELMDHGIPEQKTVNRALCGIAASLGLKTVATNDAHYMAQGDALAHEVLMCIQTGKTLADPQRMRFASKEFYLKSAAEMAEVFRELPEAVEQSGEIAERCGLELVLADWSEKPLFKFPPFPLPAGTTSPDDHLRRLCQEGALRRYAGHPPMEVSTRLDHELDVIRKMGFATYFLIVGDIVHYGKSHGILVGPGRGSAAGSLVAYTLGITDLDPLRFGLIFERFLNPGRTKEAPDIDIDFPDNRREEVVEYVRKKYGAENVAQIVTFARMNARAVVRDVGRVMGLPYGEMDKLAKLIPGGPTASLAKGLEQAELQQALAQKEEYGKLIDVAQSLESVARHASKHAAGVVIAPPTAAGEEGGLRNWVPLLRLEEGVHVTQFDMDGIKQLGLLKIDLLGLRTLTVLDETRRIVRRTRETEIDYLTIPLDDPRTYELFGGGHTDGIFQFESAGMRNNLRNLHPDRIEDLIAMNALYRPGPMEQIDAYIRRRRGQEKPAYDAPELEPILKETFGIVVYQEQVLQIVHDLAGYSMGQADDFRRSMGKKKADIMAREEKNFIENCVKRGINREAAGRIFEFLEKFAGYGFNRSHSAAYALLAYWTAYLKVHYPVEFMAALLTSEMGNQDKIAEYVSESRKLKLTVLPPDVNHSEAMFTVEAMTEATTPPAGATNGAAKATNGHAAANGPADPAGPVRQAVRFGLVAVKNVGEGAAQAVVAARTSGGPYTSLFDFCERVDTTAVNRKVMESLIKCGAFDRLGGTREQLLLGLERALERGTRRQQDQQQGQAQLFAAGAGESSEALPEVEETVERNRLSYEKELLGCYVSGHPLAEYESELVQFALQSLKADQLGALTHGQSLRIAGVVSRYKTGITKQKKETFARFHLEDLEGAIEVLVWPETFRKFGAALSNGAIVLVTGRFELTAGGRPGGSDEARPQLIANDLVPLDEAQVRLTRAVHLAINVVGTDESVLGSIRKLAELSPGEAALFLHLRTLHHGEAVLEASPALRVRPTRELVGQLRALLGDENVTLADRAVAPV